MAEIKIFVSHRIDIESERIENRLYYPVRCGAVFDTENPMRIAGDDTGENISDRRMSFCEFTVQYWAWKNMDCDYYGLCHYRRFLSFSPRLFTADRYNVVYRARLTDKAKRDFGLLDERTMERLIRDSDILVNCAADVGKFPLPEKYKKTVYGMWRSHDGDFFEPFVVDEIIGLIDELSPGYSASAREYFQGNLHRGYNCYIMKKAYFDRLCEFQFPIMFRLEKRIDTAGYTQTMGRTVAFAGEILYGIFVYHLTKYENVVYRELQLVYFNNTQKIPENAREAKYDAQNIADGIARRAAEFLVPLGSKRRETLKKIFYAFFKGKPHGRANIV